MSRSRLLPLLLLMLSTSVVLQAAQPTVPELFKRVKDEFAAGNFRASLADLDELDAASRQPSFVNDRGKLLPALAFYRGANLAATGKREDAREAFISYLALVPAASIASPPFSRDVVAAFELAQKDIRGKSGGLTGTFASFVPSGGTLLPADVLWADSPVRYLLSAAGRKAYAALDSASDRETFVNRFWKQFDPTPGTEANEFRSEFERRVAFADATFSTDTIRGRDSDRGAVFTFLGPPTYAGVTELTTGNDTLASLRSQGNSDMSSSFHSGSTTGSARLSGQQPSDSVEHDLARGRREAWYYRRARIPEGIAFNEVVFDFLTKEGYGTGVLQKDPQPLTTLGKAAELARVNKRLN